MSERGRDRFARHKSLLKGIANVLGVMPARWRLWLLERHRMTNGVRGLVLRYTILKTLARACGDNVAILTGVYLLSPRDLLLGDNVSIHPMCYIDATGGLKIGNDVSIAHGVTILSSAHEYGGKDIPIKDQGVLTCCTVVDDNVWLGARATILPGCTIHSGAVVGAGAVVTRDVSSDLVVAGVPARAIKKRC